MTDVGILQTIVIFFAFGILVESVLLGVTVLLLMRISRSRNGWMAVAERSILIAQMGYGVMDRAAALAETVTALTAISSSSKVKRG